MSRYYSDLFSPLTLKQRHFNLYSAFRTICLFTAILHLVKVYANIATRNLSKGSPLVGQKGISDLWLVENEQKLWAGRRMEL